MSILEIRGFLFSDKPASVWYVIQFILYMAGEYQSLTSMTVTQTVEDSPVLIARPKN